MIYLCGMRFLTGFAVTAVIFFLGFFLYITYWDEVIQPFFTDESTSVAIYVGDIPFSVKIADTPESRYQGLSGTPPLRQFAGMLFIFNESARHGFVMRDMNYAIDILWFDEDLLLVHVEENITPETYPKVFASSLPARYVLEIAAGTVKSLKIVPGVALTLPAGVEPIRRTLDLQ